MPSASTDYPTSGNRWEILALGAALVALLTAGAVGLHFGHPPFADAAWAGHALHMGTLSGPDLTALLRGRGPDATTLSLSLLVHLVAGRSALLLALLPALVLVAGWLALPGLGGALLRQPLPPLATRALWLVFGLAAVGTTHPGLSMGVGFVLAGGWLLAHAGRHIVRVVLAGILLGLGLMAGGAILLPLALVIVALLLCGASSAGRRLAWLVVGFIAALAGVGALLAGFPPLTPASALRLVLLSMIDASGAPDFQVRLILAAVALAITLTGLQLTADRRAGRIVANRREMALVAAALAGVLIGTNSGWPTLVVGLLPAAWLLAAALRHTAATMGESARLALSAGALAVVFLSLLAAGRSVAGVYTAPRFLADASLFEGRQPALWNVRTNRLANWLHGSEFPRVVLPTEDLLNHDWTSRNEGANPLYLTTEEEFARLEIWRARQLNRLVDIQARGDGWVAFSLREFRWL